MRNPKAEIFPISAKTGEGVEAWAQWLRDRVAAWKN
jgi:hydrogenase nickel incorporation protein HypB